MKSVLVLSNTHNADLTLSPMVKGWAKKADHVLHAGGFKSLREYKSLRESCRGDIVAVAGPHDTEELKRVLREKNKRADDPRGYTAFFTVEDVRIGLAPMIARDDSDFVDDAAVRIATGNRFWGDGGVNVLVFGGFYHPIVEWNGALLVCPGHSNNDGLKKCHLPPTAVLLSMEDTIISGIQILNMI